MADDKFIVQIELMINDYLYNEKMIGEDIYQAVHDKLLFQLKDQKI